MSFVSFDINTGSFADLDTGPGAQPKKAGAGSRLADSGVDLAKGVVGYGQSIVGIVDLLSFGAAGKGMQALGYDPARTNQWLSGFYSDARKQANEKVENAEGFVDTAFTALENPSTILGAVLESLPGTVGMGAVGYRVADRAFQIAKAGATAAGATPEAAIKAGAAAVQAAMPKILGAASAAEGAQAAGSIAQQARAEGKEWADYVLPSAAGGAGTALISRVSGGLADKIGAGNIETAIATAGKGAGTGARGGIVSRVGKGMLTEGALEEMPQSYQEQVFTNLATDRPLTEGAAGAAAMGGLVGAAMGGGNAIVSRAPAAPPQQDPQADAVDAISRAPDVDTAIRAAANAANTVSPIPSAQDIGTPVGLIGRAMLATPGEDIAAPTDAMQAMAEGFASVPEMAAYVKEGVPYTGAALTEQQQMERDLQRAEQNMREQAVDADVRANAIPYEPPSMLGQGMAGAAAEMQATKGATSPMEAARIGQEIDAAYAQRDQQRAAQERSKSREVDAMARQLQEENAADQIARAEAAGKGDAGTQLSAMQQAMLRARLERDLRDQAQQTQMPDVATTAAATPEKGDDADPGGSVAAPAEGAGGVAPTPTPTKPVNKYRPHPLDDARLKDDNTRGYLQTVADDAGWDELGGAMIMNEVDRDRTPGNGEVLGRTSYIGQDWWQSRPEDARIPGDTKGQRTRDAVRKAMAGEPLNAVERRAVKYMLDVAEQRAAMDAQDEQAAGIDELAEDEQDAAIDLGVDIGGTVVASDWSAMSEAEREAELDDIFGPSTAAREGGETVAEGAGSGAQVGEDQTRPEGGGQEPVAPRAQEDTAPSPEGVPTSGAPALELTGQTSAEVAAEAAKQAAQAAQAAAEAVKTAADAMRESFMLTGSARAADQAAARGQQELVPAETPAPESGTEPAQPETPAAPRETLARIDDVGEKIGGARKDLWRERGLSVNDLSGMSGGEQAQYATKDNVWPKIDYAKRIADGMEPKAAALLKQIRDGIASKPRADTAEGRRLYVETLGMLRDMAADARTVDDVKGLSNRLTSTLGVQNGDRASLQRLWAIYKGRTNPVRIGWDDERRADRLLKQGWPTPAKGERSTTGGDARETPDRPYLDKLQRTGEDIRGGRDVTGDEVRETFGFRGIEYGNYAAQDERQRLLNLAFDGLHDLAGLLGVPPKAISFNGTLGIAFGARGGGNYSAHYEPGKLVINMTKLRGGGSLAHEWAHALDHYFGELDRPDAYQGKARGATGWYKRGYARHENLRPEMATAFDRVMSSIYYKPGTRSTSSYVTQAGKLSGKAGSTGYWSRPTELFARAFESYVFDKITADDRVSQYLVQGVEPDRFSSERYKGNPYPTGDERAAINAAFDALVDTVETRETDRGVAMFSRLPRSQMWSGDIDGVPVRQFQMQDDAGNTIGTVTTLDVLGKPTVLFHIEAATRGQGAGQQMLRDVLERAEGAEVFIANIQPEAQDWWRSVGATLEDSDGANPNGTIDLQRFEDSEAVRRRGVPEAGERPAQGRASQAQGRSAAGASTVDAVREELGLELGQRAVSRVNVVQSAADLPADLGDVVRSANAENDVQGVHYKGQVYLVAGNIQPGKAFAVLMHESGVHDGLRKFLGAEDFKALAGQIKAWARLRTGSEQAKLAQRAMQRVPADTAADMRDEELIAYFVEEAVQAGYGSPKPQQQGAIQRWFKRLWDAVRTALRKLGTNPEALTTEDVVELARGALERSLGAKGGEAAFTLGVGESVPQTETEAFKRWFGGSKVVDAQGKPLVVYHGTRGDFDSFGNVGGRFNVSGGYYFTSRQNRASLYADSMANAAVNWNPSSTFAKEVEPGANVVPVYLAISNPLVITDKDGPFNAPEDAFDYNQGALIKAAKTLGHDGVVFKRSKGDGFDEVGAVAFRPEQIKSAIGNRGTFDPQNPDIRFSRAAWIDQMPAPTQEALRKAGVWYQPPTLKQRVQTWSQDWQKRVRQGMVDQFDPIKELDQHAYMLARMTRSADAALEGLLMNGEIYLDNDGAVDVRYEKGGFLGVLSKLNGEHDRFLAWVVGNRAERLMGEGRENNFTPEDIKRLKALNQGQMADGSSRLAAYQRALADLNRYNKVVMDMAEKAGIIDGSTRPAWERDAYIPFYRLMEEHDQTKGPMPPKGLVNQYAFKTLKGGTEALGDPLQNMLRNWSHLIDASLRNQAALASLDAAARIGGVIEGPEATMRQMAKANGTPNAVVSVMDKGAQRWMVVEDPFLVDALKSIGFTGFQGPAMKALQKVKRMLTLGVTVSPTFRIRNVIRDSLSMIGANPASYNVVSNVLTGWKGTKEGSPEFARILSGGGVMRYGTWMEGDRGEHVKRLVEAGVANKTILTTPQKIRDAMQVAWDWWQKTGDRAENVNRVALYKKLRAEGKSHLEASYAARDVMDFSMQGTWGAIRFLAQTVPFFNARLQGAYKLGRGAVADPQRFAAVTGGVALASVALLLAYADDEDWKKREGWDRETFWWFKIGDTAYRIPKPFEIGALATIAERGLEAMISDELTGKQFAERVWSIAMEQMSMNPVPQLFKPMIELWANKDSFTDRPIESMGMERLSTAERAGPNTSAVARALGAAGILSPVQIDHLVRAYFGWLGTHAVMTADFAARPLMGMPEKPAMRLDDYFVLGDFAKGLPAHQSKYVTRLYDQGKKVQQAMADVRHYREIGELEKARELAEKNREEVMLYRVYSRAQRQLATINKAIRMTQQSNSLSADEKRQRLDMLYDQRNRVAEITERRSRALRAAS